MPKAKELEQITCNFVRLVDEFGRRTRKSADMVKRAFFADALTYAISLANPLAINSGRDCPANLFSFQHSQSNPASDAPDSSLDWLRSIRHERHSY
jgi:hypothetical protein